MGGGGGLRGALVWRQKRNPHYLWKRTLIKADRSDRGGGNVLLCFLHALITTCVSWEGNPGNFFLQIVVLCVYLRLFLIRSAVLLSLIKSMFNGSRKQPLKRRS